MASVCDIWTTLYRCSFRHCHVNSFSSLLANHDIGLYGFSFPYAPYDTLRVALNHRCLVNKDVLAGVVAIDETVSVPDAKPFNGSEHSFISVSPHVDSAVPSSLLTLLFCARA